VEREGLVPLYKVRVQANYPGPGGPGLNTFHLNATDDTAFQAAQLPLKQLYQALAGTMVIGGTYTAVQDAIKDPYGQPVRITVPAWSVAGNAGGAMLPPQTMVCVSWRTALATRSGSGRSFFGPSATGLLDTDGTIQTASLQIIRDGAHAFATSQGTAGAWTYGVYSRKQQALRPFVDGVVRDRFAVLRSRRD
jgi:hypothetical protein